MLYIAKKMLFEISAVGFGPPLDGAASGRMCCQSVVYRMYVILRKVIVKFIY